jgi:3',5'-nucleoside bisphosphate phosphatase
MKSKRRIDLHLHSNKSDGVHSPTKLFEIVATAGLSAASLTDHDTLDGLAEASAAALKYDIVFIPGIEISVVEEFSETHILGYYPKNNNILNEKLSDLKTQRFARMEKTVSLLKKQGIRLNYDDVINEADGAAPGRLHLARIMLKKKYIYTLEEAFKLYLGFGKTAYVPRQTLSLSETIAVLLECDALPVIAHPGVNGMKMIPRLINMGIKGIEVFHPDHNKNLTRLLTAIADENHLIITGGSDYHGTIEAYGKYPINMAIDYCYYEKLKLAVS